MTGSVAPDQACQSRVYSVAKASHWSKDCFEIALIQAARRAYAVFAFATMFPRGQVERTKKSSRHVALAKKTRCRKTSVIASETISKCLQASQTLAPAGSLVSYGLETGAHADAWSSTMLSAALWLCWKQAPPNHDGNPGKTGKDCADLFAWSKEASTKVHRDPQVNPGWPSSSHLFFLSSAKMLIVQVTSLTSSRRTKRKGLDKIKLCQKQGLCEHDYWYEPDITTHSLVLLQWQPSPLLQQAVVLQQSL